MNTRTKQEQSARLFAALGEADPAQVEQAAAVKEPAFPRWAKYSSLAACLLVVIAAAIFISGLLGGTKVYADAFQILPPFDGVTWGMSPKKVSAAVSGKGTPAQDVLSVGDDLVFSSWDSPVFGTALFPADNAVTFGFTRETTYQGKQIPAALSYVHLLLCAEDIPATLENITQATKLYSRQEGDTYYFEDEFSKIDVTPQMFCRLYNIMYKTSYMPDADSFPEFTEEEVGQIFAESHTDLLPRICVREETDLGGNQLLSVEIYGGLPVFLPYI